MTRHIIVIGAGHNGLVAANLLADQGLHVTLLEASATMGGGAQTHEFADGFKTSSIAHLLYQWDPKLTQQLTLERYGFRQSPLINSISLSQKFTPLIWNYRAIEAGEIERREAVKFIAAMRRFDRLGQWLLKQNTTLTPRLGWQRWKDAIPALQLMVSMRLLGRDAMQDLLRMGTMPVHDVLTESFNDERLQGGLALDAVLGTRLGSRSGNSFFSLLHRLSGIHRAGGYTAVYGGMGALSHALTTRLGQKGASIRTQARVSQILITGQHARGVKLADGSEIHADGILSAMAVKPFLLDVLGAAYLSIEQTHRLTHVRHSGTAAKVHLALTSLPNFRHVAEKDLRHRLLIAPSSTAVDEAFNPVKYNAVSERPVMECHIPTVDDPSLAPQDQHVLSAVVQYVPYQSSLEATELREQVIERTLTELERYAPGIKSQVVGAECLLPTDIESRYGFPGGHWHHAELSIDQALMLRPIPKLAQYRTPVLGLWMCGAGVHPGGGMMGQSARLSVQALLHDLKHGRLGS